MDISEEYIKMCDCDEIQKEWKAKEGDFFTVKHPKEKYRPVWVFDFYDMKEYEKNYYPCVFLPRQDQIQEMVGCVPGNHLSLMGKFVKFDYYHSLEQKWLAFYMHEKHKKTWDGKEWVAEES